MKFAPYNPIADSLQSFIRGFTMPAPSPFTLDRNATGVTVVNTVTETAIYSFTVPAFSVGQDQALRLRIVGDYRNNSGTQYDYTFRIKLGATTLWEDTAPTLGSFTDRKPYLFDIVVANLNDTSAQVLMGTIMLDASSGSPAVGEGNFPNLRDICVLLGRSTEDMTTDMVLEVTVEMAAADPDTEIVSVFSMLEVV